MTGIDLNRAGTPLLEIVSEPDMRGAQEAVAYARALHALVRWIGICDGNMQEGSFRCDANVSVRRPGDAKLGTRCEIKNLNSFRFLEQAIEFEARAPDRDARGRRQDRAGDAALRPGPRRDALDAHARKTRTTTATSPIPDLLPLVVTEDDDREHRASACRSCPRRSAQRFERNTGCRAYDAALLDRDRETAPTTSRRR